MLGRDLEGGDAPVVQLGDVRCPGGGQLVQPVGAVHDPGPLGAEIGQHLGDRLDPPVVEDAEELALGAGRVRQRAQQVEYGAGAKLGPGRSDMAHGAVVARRHQEADVVLPQAFLDQRHIGVDVDAKRAQHVGRAGLRRQRPVAVLGHRHARRRRHQGGAGGDIEGARSIAAGAASVDGAIGCVDFDRLGPHHPGGADDLVDGLATDPESHEESAHLRRRRLARHDDLERLFGLDLAHASAVGDESQQFLELVGFSAHAASPPRRARPRKFLSTRWPCSEAMLSGWNWTP